jgi:hypothetical protein
VEKDWNARFELGRKKPLRWRTALTTVAIGAVALPLSLFRGGPCGPGTLAGVIVMLIGLICLPLGIFMCAFRGLITLKTSRLGNSK